jgi:tRNA threonylcarbamoyl adenosine modification protein YeaZ
MFCTAMTDSTSPAYALAIHTSSSDLGLAIAAIAPTLCDRRTYTWPLGREVSSQLHGYLQDVLAPQCWSDLAFLAVAIGPGGFTGTRIGVVTARTLAQQLAIPLFGLSSLGAIAWQRAEAWWRDHSGITLLLSVQMPARRQAVYGAIYRAAIASQDGLPDLVPVVPDGVFTPEDWQACLATHEPEERLEVQAGAGDSAVSILTWAYVAWQRGDRPDWSTVLPMYGQSPV